MFKQFPRQVLALAGSTFLGFFVLASPFLPAPAAAAERPSISNYGLENVKNIDIGKSATLEQTIADIINIALGFLGIIAVIFILYGGFLWMTAAGDEDQVGKARKMIVQAVVGLAVIFAAWAIAEFVIGQLKTATGVI